MTTNVIAKIEKKMAKVRSGKDASVKPGQPERFTAAACKGDAIRQGDLYLVIGDKVPKDFVRCEDVSEVNKQLVPGNTQGAKHCLDSLCGVELYRPKAWSEESTVGPVLVLSQDRTVQHPTHGHVTLLAGTVVECHYQREYSSELRREARARD